jgi:hypothetical protein
MLILLTVQAVIFAIWAFLMFQTLFLLARRARRESGTVFPGVGATLTEWRVWLTSDADKAARTRLGTLTLLILFTSALNLIK